MKTKSLVEEVLRSSEILYVGELYISKMSTRTHDPRVMNRYVIYLPVRNAELWKVLWESRRKVRIYLELINEESNEREVLTQQ